MSFIWCGTQGDMDHFGDDVQHDYDFNVNCSCGCASKYNLTECESNKAVFLSSRHGVGDRAPVKKLSKIF
uniref:Uncharacterized protein n=1 Tax=Arion vulgaris TaxID=1028688 RepID=A0A0B7ANE4_9EUPU